ncbi:hypothetical protein [Micromonospora sp. HM5-17]|uniref:hypothetical protein n=1 Tax=Micromonospora sp. HM5-17 TaxID=2487710 RepID=UPI000F48E5CC|nr:hypothetical protein [Micromonospora sp. HM5-17]ROT29329.1 hypothetical protein EF879_20290 [Micromonospora sp. HM5-17]
MDRIDRGTFTAAYGVRLADGTDLVLKVAPPPELTLPSHEVDLMRTEVDVYRRAARVGVPVPEVRYAGAARRRTAPPCPRCTGPRSPPTPPACTP